MKQEDILCRSDRVIGAGRLPGDMNHLRGDMNQWVLGLGLGLGLVVGSP